MLERTNVYLANAVTLVIVMFGWAIFRAPSIDYLKAFVQVLLNPFAKGEPFFVPPPVEIIAVIGIAVCAMPRMPFYGRLETLYKDKGAMTDFATTGLMILFFLACARSATSSFQPFLYFRF